MDGLEIQNYTSSKRAAGSNLTMIFMNSHDFGAIELLVFDRVFLSDPVIVYVESVYFKSKISWIAEPGAVVSF